MEPGLLNTLGEFLVTSPWLGYALLSVTFIIRGEVAILIGTALAMQGYISFPTFYFIGAVSVLFIENAIYLTGRFTRGTRLGQFLERRIPFLPRIRTYITHHFIAGIFLAKYAVGFVAMMLFSAGWAGIPFRRFIPWHTLSLSVWLVVMSSVSYLLLSALGYLQATSVLRRIEWGILIFIVLFITAEIIIQKRLEKRALTRRQT